MDKIIFKWYWQLITRRWWTRVSTHARPWVDTRRSSDLGCQLMWSRSFLNDIGNLSQGVGGRVKGAATIYFIKHEDIPADRKVNYGRIVVDYLPQKEYRKSTSEVIVNITIDQRCSKFMEMSFYWLRDRNNQKHFQFYWARGSQNLGDYNTKHRQEAHHCAIIDIYLHR